jgi:hypothetical protein
MYIIPTNQPTFVSMCFFLPHSLSLPGLHELVHDSIMRADMDLRKILFSQVVLSGGSTLYRGVCGACHPLSCTPLSLNLCSPITTGFGHRLLNELRNATHIDHPEMRIRVVAPPKRQFSTWIGGYVYVYVCVHRMCVCVHVMMLSDPSWPRWPPLRTCGACGVAGVEVAPLS